MRPLFLMESPGGMWGISFPDSHAESAPDRYFRKRYGSTKSRYSAVVSISRALVTTVSTVARCRSISSRERCCTYRSGGSSFRGRSSGWDTFLSLTSGDCSHPVRNTRRSIPPQVQGRSIQFPEYDTQSLAVGIGVDILLVGWAVATEKSAACSEPGLPGRRFRTIPAMNL
jgi:hypothetical protein